MKFERILVRATNWVGDAVMSLPALHALRREFPQSEISILARPWVADLYGREPFCDKLIPYHAPRGWKGLGEKWQATSALKKTRFDCAILLQNAFEAAALSWLARIPVRIGYNRDGRGLLLTHAIPAPQAGETPPHQRFYYLELLRRAALIKTYPEDPETRLTAAPVAAEAGRKKFAQLNMRTPVIGVSPGAAYGSAKRWLPERFAQAAIEIAKERNAAVALFGSAQERALCDEVLRLVSEAGISAINMAGHTVLGEFIDMAAACELFLTNDSGAMHIAYALGLPTVAIFGATDHVATGPVGSRSRIVRHAVECSPCLLRECPIDHRCMTRVGSDQVASVALDLLK